MANQRERSEALRERKLQELDEAIAEGRVVVRTMTDAERKKFPAQDRPPKRTPKRR